MFITALELAAEYGLYDWIRALLDPAEITQTPSSTKKPIAAPPKFEPPMEKTKIPASAKGSRSRGTRSASPSKATPAKARASPKKRQTKAQKDANNAHANAASAALQSALDDAVSVAEAETSLDSTALDSILPSPPPTSADSSDMVKVEVDQSVEVEGNTEITHTNVTIEMPAGSPELPLPEDTEQMLETARKMVEEAKALDGLPKISKKRKALDPEPSDIDAALPVQPAKKARVLEEKLKREKVRTRAMLGVTATLAIA